MTCTLIIILLIAAFFLYVYISNNSSFFSAPFLGTEPKIVQRMLDIANLKKGQVLYDLGSGDGRIVVSAALRGAKAVGVELDPLNVLYSRFFIKIMKLDKKAIIIRKNFFETSLKEANVVTLFLLNDTNQKLKSKLKKELKPGSRVVSYSFILEGWKPVKTYLNTDSIFGPIYLYKIGK